MKTLFTFRNQLVLLFLLMLPVAVLAQQSPVDKLFEKYANKKGFTTVNISGSLLAMGAKADTNKAEADMLSSLKGIRILSVEDEALNQSIDFFKEMNGDQFFKKNNYEVLMEVTEDDEVVRFFARRNSAGEFTELLLIVAGDDNALISIQGAIDPASISKITQSLNFDF